MVEDIIEVLQGSRRVVITTHVRPDGDAIGSQLALGLFLRKLGKNVHMINAHSVPWSLSWLESASLIEEYAEGPSHYQAFAAADTIVAVDVNSARRLGESVARSVKHSSAKKVLIDHHLDPENWFDHQYVREHEAATGVLIYELICAWDERQLQGPIATALYTAILTDTGSFRFPTVTPAVHRIVADLLERGSDSPASVYAATYQSRSTEWPLLLAHVLRTFVLRYGGKLGYIVVSSDARQNADADHGDTEGLVEFALAVDGVEIALMFTESRIGTKVSFRSRGTYSVVEWAQAFGGGGHRNAAGALVRASITEAVARVVEAAPQYTGLRDQPSEVLAREDLDLLTQFMSS